MYKQPLGRSISFFVLLAGPLLLLGVSRVWAEESMDVPTSSSAVTLQQCYQKALQVNETLEISDEEIAQITAIYRQGVGNVLPHLSWNMTQFWQDTSSIAESTSGVQGTLTRKRRPESFFQLEQPLFHGLRDFHALKGFKSALRSSEYTKKQAELNLLEDVAEVFYTSLDLQQELASLYSQRELTEDRLKELQRRVRLGRSRDSEVLSSEVELASLEAQIEDTRQRWHVARQTLKFLTEVPVTVPLIEQSPLPTLPTIEEAHTKSMGRPDLLAAGYTQEQERYRVAYAKGGFFPDLDFVGRYYTERVGFTEEIKWDALLSLQVPIFTGFTTRAEVQEARSKAIVADLYAARLKRQIRQQVETAHQFLHYSTTQTQFYEKAVRLAQQNYKLQVEEYRLGLINNLQVLDVLTDLQDLQIRKLRVDAAMRISHIKLLVATGQGL